MFVHVTYSITHFLHVDPFSVLNIAYKGPEGDKVCRVDFSIPVSDSLYSKPSAHMCSKGYCIWCVSVCLSDTLFLKRGKLIRLNEWLSAVQTS